MIATVLVAACAGSSQVGQIEIAPAEPPAMPVATPEELPPPPAAPNVARGDAPRAIGRCDASAGARRFTIAHVNDMQARYTERIAGASRYAYVAGYLEALKDEVPETLVMDAGDDYEKGRSPNTSVRQTNLTLIA